MLGNERDKIMKVMSLNLFVIFVVITICLSSNICATMFTEQINVAGQGELLTMSKTNVAEDNVQGTGIQEYSRNFTMESDVEGNSNDLFSSHYQLENSTPFSFNKYIMAMHEPGLLHSVKIYGNSKNTKIDAIGSISDSGGSIKTHYSVQNGTFARFAELLRDSTNSTHPIDLAETKISGKSDLFTVNSSKQEKLIQLNGISAEETWKSVQFNLVSDFTTKGNLPDWQRLNNTFSMGTTEGTPKA